MTESNQSFFRSNLDKFILVFMVLVFVGIGYHASHHMEDINSGYSQFVQQNAGLMIGALLTLLTIGSKKGSSSIPSAVDTAESISNLGGTTTSTVRKVVDTTTVVPPQSSESKGVA